LSAEVPLISFRQEIPHPRIVGRRGQLPPGTSYELAGRINTREARFGVAVGATPRRVRHVLVNGTPIRCDGRSQINSLERRPGMWPEIA
jgi:hypothetical protein